MKNSFRLWHCFLLILVFGVGMSAQSMRVPAEWEPHEATWMQWPKFAEASYKPNFASIIGELQAYETVNIIVESESAQTSAESFLQLRGVPLNNLNWYILPYDWAWMRDNGPIWVERNGQLIIEDWAFDAWGGNVVPYWDLDDAVPTKLAAELGLRSKSIPLINEKGNLEFNGAGAMIASWPVMRDREPGVSRIQWETQMRKAFGVTQFVWLLSAPISDAFTGGHTDGICRFIDENTVVVSRMVDTSHVDYPVYEEAAQIVEDAGFTVVRLDIPGSVVYRGVPMDANYVNWLVANDVVVMTGFDHPTWDEAARQTVEGFFPNRDVVIVETLELWYWGGGIHCVTNDQPLVQSNMLPDENDSQVSLAGTPKAFLLAQNYPNPFNPSTVISFQLPVSSHIQLTVYDVNGRTIRELANGQLASGTYEFSWDGTNDTGEKVATGMYIYRLDTDEGFSQSRKMVLLQ